MKRTPSQENIDFTTLPRTCNNQYSSGSVNVTTQQEFIRNNIVFNEATKHNSTVLDRLPNAVNADTTTSVLTHKNELNTLPIGIPGFTTRRLTNTKKIKDWDDKKTIDMQG